MRIISRFPALLAILPLLAMLAMQPNPAAAQGNTPNAQVDAMCVQTSYTATFPKGRWTMVPIIGDVDGQGIYLTTPGSTDVKFVSTQPFNGHQELEQLATWKAGESHVVRFSEIKANIQIFVKPNDANRKVTIHKVRPNCNTLPVAPSNYRPGFCEVTQLKIAVHHSNEWLRTTMTFRQGDAYALRTVDGHATVQGMLHSNAEFHAGYPALMDSAINRWALETTAVKDQSWILRVESASAPISLDVLHQQTGHLFAYKLGANCFAS